jgi:hypothetical protein
MINRYVIVASVAALASGVAVGVAQEWRWEAKYSTMVTTHAKVMQDYSDRASKAETAQREEGERRQDEKDKIQNEAKERIATAQADAARAASERDRMRSQLAAFTASHRGAGQNPATGTGGQGEPGEDAISVLAGLLDRHTAELVEVGRYADELRSAGLTCERQYDSLIPMP